MRSPSLILTIGLLAFTTCHAGRGGADVGAYNHGNDLNNNANYNHLGNNNINNDDVNNRVWINPGAVYVNPTVCSTTQQCDDNGNCVQTQLCN